MKKLILFLAITILSASSYAQQTKRIPQFSNDKVSVWQTIVYPSKDQILKMHHHDEDRVVIALTDGVLKVVNDKGQSHNIFLKKHHSYYLPKDNANENHTDENISGKPIKVIVINLKNS